MHSDSHEGSPLSPWWRQAVILVMILGFSLLGLVTVKTYSGAPPIPAQVVDESGKVLFTEADVNRGQDVFFKYGLMEHGTLWGHGAYLGPDYTAEYLHRMAEIGRDTVAMSRFGKPFAQLEQGQSLEVGETVKKLVKQNRYDPATHTLTYSVVESAALQIEIQEWKTYFSGEVPAPGLPKHFIQSDEELKALATYFSWATWATVAPRPGVDYSYTNNWPYEPLVGNLPSSSAYLWSAMSLITLLGGLGLILFIFGKFDYLGWGAAGANHPHEGRLHNWGLSQHSDNQGQIDRFSQDYESPQPCPEPADRIGDIHFGVQAG